MLGSLRLVVARRGPSRRRRPPTESLSRHCLFRNVVAYPSRNAKGEIEMSIPHGSGKDLAFSVDNTDFLVDVLHKDCHPLQFLRELTQNGIEAVLATGAPGRVTWDVDWLHYDLADEPIYKLCVTDTGVGMNGEEQKRYINHLSSSIHEQSMDGNYGVGAKIAAMPEPRRPRVFVLERSRWLHDPHVAQPRDRAVRATAI